jgi:lysine-specific histone demethylase 1
MYIISHRVILYRFNSTITHIVDLNWSGTVDEIDSTAMFPSFGKGETGNGQENILEGSNFSPFAPMYNQNTSQGYWWPEAGFGGMAEIVASEEKLNIQFETVITKIEQDGDKVTLETEGGDVYTANRVVVTLPLGVLKEGNVEFAPPLSDEKNVAIERLGFGTCNKVFLAFDEVEFASAPWASGCVGGSLEKCEALDISTNAECEAKCAGTLNQMEYFAVEASRQEQPSYFLNMQAHPTHGGVPVMGVWVCGPDAKIFEDEPSLFVERTLEVLRNIHPELGEPTDTMFSSWGNDRFSRGSYSFNALGSIDADRDTLAVAHDRIHFAGEHTTRSWGTVHGAFGSGERAANEVLAGGL